MRPSRRCRVLLGRPLTDIRAAYEARLSLWEEWLPEMEG